MTDEIGQARRTKGCTNGFLMVDAMLMQALMKATPDNAPLLIVGDIDQLPSVGPRQILGDVIASGVVPVICLTEVFR
jgi:exodeoxyribonuclease V alpha subunit